MFNVNNKKIEAISNKLNSKIMNENTKNSKLELNTTSEAINEADTSTNSNNMSTSIKTGYLCRLCQSQCQSERQLHDHITRIHGGSDVRRKQNNYIYFNRNTNNTDAVEDDASIENSTENDNDDDDHDDNYDVDDLRENNDKNNHQLNNKSKKLKIIDQSKGSLNNNNSIKNKKQLNDKKTKSISLSSNKKKLITTNNKNKIDKKSLFNSNNYPKPNVAIRVAKVAYYNNKNLNNTNSSINSSSNIFTNGMRGNFFSQERLPLKSCKIKLSIENANNNDNNNVSIKTKLTKNEINKFFRSLLVYIPNEILTIDDLIKPNNLNNDNKEDFYRIHSLILNSKECGITLNALKLKSNINSMNLLQKLLNILLKNYLILSVGVCERVYVAHEFCQPWIILSYKNQKGCNYAASSSSSSSSIVITPASDDNTVQNTASNIFINETEQHVMDPLDNEMLLKQKQYKKVWLIPRPWRYIDGLLNRQMLEKIFESIILYLKMYPQSTLENISTHYCPVLQPIMTLELLEMLETLDCVKCTKLTRESECTLDSNFDHDSNYVLNDDNLNGNEICIYECNPDAIFILKQIFSI